jgi:hypothetical protein
MNNRIHLIAERMWGVIALLALLAAVWHIVTGGWESGKSTLIFPGIAGAWYMTRRGLRRRLEGAKPEDGLG